MHVAKASINLKDSSDYEDPVQTHYYCLCVFYHIHASSIHDILKQETYRS